MKVLRGRWWVGLIAGLALLVLPSVASAGVISFGVWYGFSWSGSASPGSPLPTIGSTGFGTLTDPGSSPWTFVAPAAGAIFTVTDMQADIDSFAVWDGGGFIGSTPLAGSAISGCGITPESCIAAGYSNASFLLGVGAHSIELFNVDPTGFTGYGAFRVDAVPEPATLLLVGSGLVGLTLRRRRS